MDGDASPVAEERMQRSC